MRVITCIPIERGIWLWGTLFRWSDWCRNLIEAAKFEKNGRDACVKTEVAGNRSRRLFVVPGTNVVRPAISNSADGRPQIAGTQRKK